MEFTAGTGEGWNELKKSSDSKLKSSFLDPSAFTVVSYFFAKERPPTEGACICKVCVFLAGAGIAEFVDAGISTDYNYAWSTSFFVSEICKSNVFESIGCVNSTSTGFDTGYAGCWLGIIDFKAASAFYDNSILYRACGAASWSGLPSFIIPNCS